MMFWRKPKPVKKRSSVRRPNDHRRHTEGSTSSDHEQRKKKEKKSKKKPHQGTSTSVPPEGRSGRDRRSTDGARGERRNDGKTRSTPVEAQGSTKEEETPRKPRGKERSDKQDGTTSARGSERKTDSPETASAQKNAPAKAKEGGENGHPKKTAVITDPDDNWELRRMRAREDLRRVDTAGGVSTPGTGVPNGSGTHRTSGRSMFESEDSRINVLPACRQSAKGAWGQHK